MEIENAKIENVSITMADHGCLTFWITLKGDGGVRIMEVTLLVMVIWVQKHLRVPQKV